MALYSSAPLLRDVEAPDGNRYSRCRHPFALWVITVSGLTAVVLRCLPSSTFSAHDVLDVSNSFLASADLDEKRNAMLLQIFKAAPKVELHTHLDGALQPSTLCSLAFKNNATNLLNTSFVSASVPQGCRIGVRKGLTALPHPLISSLESCPFQLQPYVTSFETKSLSDFLQPFTCISDFIQLPGGIETMGRSFVLQQVAENIIYTEAQFAPQLLLTSCNPFVTCKADSVDMIEEIKHIIKKTIDGIVSVEARGAPVRILLDCFRNLKVPFCEQLLNIAIDMKKSEDGTTSAKGTSYRYSEYIVGVNLAGDEIGFPNQAHSDGQQSFEDLFKRMKNKLNQVGLGFAPHSGEPSFNDSAADCFTAISSMGASRIGHGYHCAHGSLNLIAKRHLHIETCPTSSVATGAVTTSWAHHPIRTMNRLGLSISLNTDDRAVIGTTMTAQHLVARTNLGFSLKAIVRTAVEGAKASFASEHIKVESCSRIRKWWNEEAARASESWRHVGLASHREIEDLEHYLHILQC